MDRKEQINKLKVLLNKSFYDGETLIATISKAILDEVLNDCLISQGWKDDIFNRYCKAIDRFVEGTKEVKQQ